MNGIRKMEGNPGNRTEKKIKRLNLAGMVLIEKSWV
jgi:hypothetical protein